MTTTNDLPARLLEHAAVHEELAAYYEPPAEHQAQWAKDLRDAAKDVARCRWLRDHGGRLIGECRGMGPYWPSPDEVDEIVDAACAELERIAEPADTQSFARENGAERLCRILYGRGAEIGDTIGGLDAKMLHDAVAELERLRRAVLPEED